MNCPYCGAPVVQGQTSCGSCGRVLPQQAAPAQAQTYYAAPQTAPIPNQTYNAMPMQNAGYTSEQYKPLSPWAYIGYSILFSLPIVGFILMIVFSVDSTGNINRRNFARSYLILIAIGIVISIIITILALVLGVAFSDIPDLSGLT